MKSIALSIFMAALLGATFFAVENVNLVSNFQEDSFKNLWNEDLQKLESSGRLPSGWSDLQNVEMTVASATLKPWVEKGGPDFHVKPAGKYKLQIFLDDFKEGSSTGVLIQYSLVDLQTKDTVWELGRTLQF